MSMTGPRCRASYKKPKGRCAGKARQNQRAGRMALLKKRVINNMRTKLLKMRVRVIAQLFYPNAPWQGSAQDVLSWRAQLHCHRSCEMYNAPQPRSSEIFE
ncbi:unnamed protein product, partial [Effrenium voratum]